MKKIYILWLLLMGSALSLSAQDVVLDVKVDSLPQDKKVGPNMKHFMQNWYGFGFVLGNNDPRMEIVPVRSAQFAFGILYKRKITGFWSVGFTPHFTTTAFVIRQQQSMSVTDSLFWNTENKTHVKERFMFNSVGLSLFSRFNFDPHRGNNIGSYFELGGGTDYTYASSYVAEDMLDNGIQVESRFRGLFYHSALQHYAYGRFGFGFFSVGLHYRFSDLFQKKYELPTLPPFVLRFVFGLSPKK